MQQILELMSVVLDVAVETPLGILLWGAAMAAQVDACSLAP